MCFLKNLFGSQKPGLERPSPGNWIPTTAIGLLPTGVFIDYEEVQEFLGLSKVPKHSPLWEIPNTNSMDGVFDAGNNNLLIAGATLEDHAKLVERLIVGDIAVYQAFGDRYDVGYAIHRIVEIRQTEVGRVFIFMGDNNAGIVDPYSIVPSMIKWISVGVIY